MNQTDYPALARMMKALASPVRLRIATELNTRERCMCELQPLFRMNKSTLSRHITALRQAGIVGERQDGVRRLLTLKTPCILQVCDCTARVVRGRTNT